MLQAVFAVVSPGMALVTTFGFVWALGFPFSNILTVVPFLVITIGIDDAFLILAGWRHSRYAPRNDKVDVANTMISVPWAITKVVWVRALQNPERP